MNEQALWRHAQRALLNELREAGIDPFKTKMHFRLNKLRKEIRMERTLENYIERLKIRIIFLEDIMTIGEGTHNRKQAEVITLHIVIKDLQELGSKEERFSYWK